MKLPELKQGEVYIGGIISSDGKITHTILLPENFEVTWDESMGWAKSIEGDLPNRIEQAMLWANHRDQFQHDWYWSNELHHRESGWAWYQDFSTGRQNFCTRINDLRARTVRRVSIGDDL